MRVTQRFSTRQAGAVSWPQLLGVIGAVLLALWLYQRHLANKAYGPSVIAHSLAVLKLGKQQVEATVYDTGLLPKNAEAVGFMPYDQSIGTPDRTVQLRLNMLENGELKLNYNGWIFSNASLTLTPSLGSDALSWKCTPAGIPSDLIREWCAQIEQNVIKLATENPAGAKPAYQIEDERWIAELEERKRRSEQSDRFSETANQHDITDNELDEARRQLHASETADSDLSDHGRAKQREELSARVQALEQKLAELKEKLERFRCDGGTYTAACEH